MLLSAAGPAGAITNFQVSTTADSGPGSLRQAMLDANANPGTDAITFADLGASHKIAPTTPLPAVSDPVTIDGYTHPGASPNTQAVGDNAVLQVQLSGEKLTGTPDGLDITAGDSVVRGLVIDHFAGRAIYIETNGGNSVEGNFIGTDPTGTAAAANDTGVEVDNTLVNDIGGTTAAARNLISGNTHPAVLIHGTFPGNAVLNTVQGNYIGLNKLGTAGLPNGDGVVLGDANDTTVGGVGVLARNVIATTGGSGVFIFGSSPDRNIVRGNYIGTDRSGTATVGHSREGIDVSGGVKNVIGGTAAGQGNVVASGNVGIKTTGGTGTVIQGNRIGTNAAGTAPLANQTGLEIDSLVSGLTIGGTTGGARNLISGNTFNGVLLMGNGDVIQGNYIGTDAAGTGAIPNGNSGISLLGTADRIGGAVAGARNVIAGNHGDGIEVGGFTSATSIAGDYIGVGADGVTPLGNALNGVRIDSGAKAMDIGASTSTPGLGAGNVISGNGDSGISVSDAVSSAIHVDGNLIGLDSAGLVAVPNGQDGVSIWRSSSSVTLGGTSPNVISGNDVDGVLLTGATTSGNQVAKNLIGLNQAGTGAVPNGTGVQIAGGAHDNVVGVGVQSGPGSNTISGNRFEGVYLHGAGTSGNVVAGNRIGTRADGSAAVPNGRGVVLAAGAQENTVGGFSDTFRNLISGNRTDGVLITGAETDFNQVAGDYIGTNVAGTAALSNGFGVEITAGARSNTVGSPSANTTTVISGNRSAGVRVADADTIANRVRGSVIGTAPDGATAVPNGVGVIVSGGPQSTGVGPADVIARNAGSGVLVDGTDTGGAEITRNRIFGNGKLAINLRPAGEAPDTVTPNDLGDADTGPNGLQNFPVIRAATGSVTGTTISGTFNSTGQQRYRIEVFSNPVGSGAASQAQDLVGVVFVTTDASGNATWTLSAPPDLSGQVLRATATNTSTRDTSELSAIRTVA